MPHHRVGAGQRQNRGWRRDWKSHLPERGVPGASRGLVARQDAAPPEGGTQGGLGDGLLLPNAGGVGFPPGGNLLTAGAEGGEGLEGAGYLARVKRGEAAAVSSKVRVVLAPAMRAFSPMR